MLTYEVHVFRFKLDEEVGPYNLSSVIVLFKVVLVMGFLSLSTPYLVPFIGFFFLSKIGE